MSIVLCDYGCEREGRYRFKNGKICCSKRSASCPANKNKTSFSKPIKEQQRSIRGGIKCRKCNTWKPRYEFEENETFFYFCGECRK